MDPTSYMDVGAQEVNKAPMVAYFDGADGMHATGVGYNCKNTCCTSRCGMPAEEWAAAANNLIEPVAVVPAWSYSITSWVTYYTRV